MKKIIDSQGRLFGRISIIDAAVLLVVVVLVLAVYHKNTGLEVTSATSSDTVITFTALAENLPLHVVEAIRENDPVYDSSRASGGAIGKITKIEILPAETVVELRNGGYAAVTNEDGRNVLVTVEGRGSVSGGRYAINRLYELGVNTTRRFVTPWVSFRASVLSIQ